MAKKAKIKIKVKEIKSKIKIIEKEPEESDLEEQLDEDANQEFSEFISSGRMPVPILETGQVEEQAVQLPRSSQARGERNETLSGAQLNYIGRNFGEDNRPRYSSNQLAGTTILREERGDTGRREFGENKELSSIRGHSEEGDRYNIKVEGVKQAKRRYPWEE